MKQNLQVNNHTVSNYRDAGGGQDSGRKKVKCELLVSDDYGVSGVVAALVANDVINAAAE
jgi:hypothetical protein